MEGSPPPSTTGNTPNPPTDMHQIADAAGAVLETIVNDVQSHIKAFNKHNANAWKSFKAFLSAIDWTVRCIADEIRPSHGCDQEPWIRALLALHVTLLLLVILTRKRMAVQGVVFFASMAAVYLAEHLNSLLAAQWESFSTQPYFDKQGVFISAVYSAPLLLVMFVILINYLLATVDMLIKMKRKQIRYEIRQRARRQDAPAPAQTKKER